MESKLPLFVVSLKNSSRREMMKKKLNGFNYVFFDAIYGKDYPENIEEINKTYYIKQRYSRLMTAGEYGCAQSHKAIYKIMVEKNIKWAIILEDDVDFKFNFQEQLIEILDILSPDNLYLLGCQEGLESFDYVIKSSKDSIIYKKINFFKTVKSGRYLYRTAGYLISKEVAKNILDFTEDKFCLADDWLVFLKNDLFKNIYLGDFVKHPVELEGQSMLEQDRPKKQKFKLLKNLHLYYFLRNCKKYYRILLFKYLLSK